MIATTADPFVPSRPSRRRFRRSLLATAVALGAWVGAAGMAMPAAHAEDVALCIGVNQYSQLRPGANLDGCVNDARLFASKLAVYGFRHPVVLADGDATKANILAKIAALRQRLGPNDRAVVYFAGHGTISTRGESVILPSDALDDSEQNDIAVGDLYSAVKQMGGGAKTVVLDSCHSGGMVRGIAGLRGFHQLRPRFYVRTRDLNKPATHGKDRELRQWQEAAVDGSDDLSTVVAAPNAPIATAASDSSSDGTICYFAAAQKDEVANETEIGGEVHGVFTYYLVESMHGNGDVWQNVCAAVSDHVAGDTSQEQKPLLYPNTFLAQNLFGGTGATVATFDTSASAASAPGLNFDDVWNLSRPDESMVSLKRFPDRTPVPVGQPTYFTVTVGQDGYLVVINRDPKNDMYLLYPRGGDPDAMRVHAGQVIRVPGDPNHVVKPDTAGADGLKAILFTSEDAAQKMLQPFLDQSMTRGGRGVPLRMAKREWVDSTIGDPSAFFTSEMNTLIVPAPSADAQF